MVGLTLGNVALGQKRTSPDVRPMSALPPKADIGTQSWNVRFVPKADISLIRSARRQAIKMMQEQPIPASWQW